MNPSIRHFIFRITGLIIGILLFYAPFAFATRLLLNASNSPLTPDAHRICLRMPFEWLSQPWMYARLFDQPLFLIAPLLLPAIAFIFGPLFCGWLCPAGAIPEFLSKLIPGRFQFKLPGWMPPTAVRYGVLAGMVLSPFLGGYVCCTFCNFTMAQNVVSALFGDFTGFAAWSSFTVPTFLLWLFGLGLFLKGGRGWCGMLCPAGAAQGLAHYLGGKFRFSFGIKRSSRECRKCGKCVKVCPMGALSTDGSIDRHACNTCFDCKSKCPSRAIQYGLK